MSYVENIQNTLRHVKWQDYRGSKESVVVNFECAQSSILPIRDVLGEADRGAKREPNIETHTYGFSQCVDARTRNSFVKNRKGYMFFLTNYQGQSKKHKGRDFIVGYYHILQTADVRKSHMRNMEEEMCPDLDFCHALRSLESKFVPIEEAFELSSDKLKEWGYKGKLSRQLKLAFNEEKTNEVLDFFSSKQDASALYIEEIAKAVNKLREKEASEDQEEEETEEEDQKADDTDNAEEGNSGADL